LYNKLKVGGTLIIVVPCEQPSESSFTYNKNDVNKHLFTWCPMTLGNLLNYVGFDVVESLPIRHQWCSDYIKNYMEADFHNRCIENAKKNGNYQVRTICKKIL
jgi:hypothetical protein